MDYLLDQISGHGFDTDTLKPEESFIDDETFLEALKRFLISESYD